MANTGIPPGKRCKFNNDEDCVHYIEYRDPAKGLCLKLSKQIEDCAKICGENTAEYKREGVPSIA